MAVGLSYLIETLKMAKNTDRRLDDGDIEHGSVYSVSGPVVIAENMLGCQMYELVSRLIH